MNSELPASPDRRTRATELPGRPSLRVRGPADLLEAIPYLIGFHPQHSAVLVGLRQTELVVTVRLDLGDITVPGVLSDAVRAMRNGGVAHTILLVYDEFAGTDGQPLFAPLPHSDVVETVAHVTAAHDCELHDALLVGDGAWWSYECDDALCCPPSGQPLPATGTSAVAAAATFAGLVALPDRDTLTAILDPIPEADRAALGPLIAEHEQRATRAVLDGTASRHTRSVKRALFAAARRAEAADAPTSKVSATEAARFGAALRSIAVRDSVWMAVDDGRLDGRELWCDLARRLPVPYAAGPLFLFGWRSWRAGNGALAGVAAQRAIEADPAYSAADLLLAAVARGVDPRRLPRLRLPRSA